MLASRTRPGRGRHERRDIDPDGAIEGPRALDLYGKALELRDSVGAWLDYIPETFPHYTRHTIDHSEEINRQIGNLVYDRDQGVLKLALSPVEVYVLIAAAYLHDSGMVASPAEKTKLLQSGEWGCWTTN